MLFYAVPRSGVDLANVETAVDEQIAQLLKDGVTAGEVASTIKRMLSAAVYARDGLETGARVLGQALANGGTIADVEEWPDRLAKVTPDDVMGAARLVLQP